MYAPRLAWVKSDSRHSSTARTSKSLIPAMKSDSLAFPAIAEMAVVKFLR